MEDEEKKVVSEPALDVEEAVALPGPSETPKNTRMGLNYQVDRLTTVFSNYALFFGILASVIALAPVIAILFKVIYVIIALCLIVVLVIFTGFVILIYDGGRALLALIWSPINYDESQLLVQIAIYAAPIAAGLGILFSAGALILALFNKGTKSKASYIAISATAFTLSVFGLLFTIFMYVVGLK